MKFYSRIKIWGFTLQLSSDIKGNMNKIFRLCALAVINCSVLYLIYWCLFIACSTKVDNILHIPYEPSGMQLFFYFISFPFFMVLALLSFLHSYYFDLKKSLSLGIIIIWFSYFILILYVNLVIHFAAGSNFLYYGSLIISFIALPFVIYTTYYQIIQSTKSKKG